MKVQHDNSNKSVVIGRSNSLNRFLCFKLLDMEIDPETVTDKVVFYPATRNQTDKYSSEKERKMDSRDEKGSRRLGLTRAVKAVLFYTKLRRKNLESKMVSESMRRDSSSNRFRFTKRNHDFESKIGLMKSSSTRSTSSSISLSSSTLSSCLSSRISEPSTPISSSIQNPKPPKQSSLKKQVHLDEQSSGLIIMGFLLILTSLTFTIFWGRLWAIALNAIWLYLIPRNGSSGRREKCLEVEKSESSGEQSSRRRRVIMEGLLDTKH